MDNWEILIKELSWYGYKIVGKGNCQVYNDASQIVTLHISKAIKMLSVNNQKNIDLFGNLWNEIGKLFKQEVPERDDIIDEKVKTMFIFSVKELSKLVICFPGTNAEDIIKDVLNCDIKKISKEQMSLLPHYKQSIDWVHRLIHRNQYVIKLLRIALKGKERVERYVKKIAYQNRVSGPWSNVYLPEEETKCPWDYEEEDLKNSDRDKWHQERYQKGFENYNGGFVAEGHQWVEPRNQPFLWGDDEENPYPHRDLLFNN